MFRSNEILVQCRKSYSYIAHIIMVSLAMSFMAIPATASAADNDSSSSVISIYATSDDFRLKSESKKENNIQKEVTGDADTKFRALHAAWGGKPDAGTKSLSIPSIDPVSKVDISSYYGYRTDPFKGRRKNHKGLDIRGPVGTPIFATADGFVKMAQWFSSYGKFIEIDHGNAIHTRYGHLSKLNVKANQRVKKGDIIGYMGSTGRSTGSHLHYEVRIAGEPVNPQSFMAYQKNDAVKLVEKANEKDSAKALGGPNQ